MKQTDKAQATPLVTPSTTPLTTPLVTVAPWDTLQRFTDARIALGRAGHSLPTAAHLAFQAAQAQARDAVYLPFDTVGMAQSLSTTGLPLLQLHSAAADRPSYLQRPDLGRQLNAASRTALQDWHTASAPGLRHDVAFVVADGLSALAVHVNAAPLLSAVLELLRNDPAHKWSIAPIALVQQGRVAVGDEVGQLLQADMVVVLIGERPGLSAPDSLGVYLSWNPQVGMQDAQRNCISNVREAGLSMQAAAAKLHYLLARARSLQMTGIGLKDEAAGVAGADAPKGLATSSVWRML